MGTRYIVIDSSKLFLFLESFGFSRSITPNSEVVYSQAYVGNPNLVVKIYTSVSSGDTVARDIGEDAIRITAVDTQISKGIYKGARVYRTGSQGKVHARIKERFHEAFQRCMEYDKSIAISKHLPPAPPKPREFTLREEVQLRLTVSDCVERDTAHGIRYVFTMHNDAGQTFVYWSGWPDRLIVNETYDVKGIVYGFNTFRGVKQISLSELRGKKVIQ